MKTSANTIHCNLHRNLPCGSWKSRFFITLINVTYINKFCHFWDLEPPWAKMETADKVMSKTSQLTYQTNTIVTKWWYLTWNLGTEYHKNGQLPIKYTALFLPFLQCCLLIDWLTLPGTIKRQNHIKQLIQDLGDSRPKCHINCK